MDSEQSTSSQQLSPSISTQPEEDNPAENVTEPNVGTIDCLSVPPPYTSEPPVRLTPNTSHQSSVSVDNIADYDDMETQRSKVCCDAMLCKFCLAGCFRFKRVLFMMSVAGAVSVVGAIILGAAKTEENNFLTLSLMFAGLGLVLITVVMIGWRCTPSDHEPCHLLFGLGSYSMVPQRPFFGRRTRHSSRYCWFGDRLFPEFRYRRPPPTYALSMQEYNQSPSCFRTTGNVPNTPPPAYKLYNSQRNRARKGVHIIYPRLPTDPHCLPPLYRERTGYQSSRRLTNLCSQNVSQLAGADNQAFVRETAVIAEATMPELTASVSQASQENRQSVVLGEACSRPCSFSDNHASTDNSKPRQQSKRKRTCTSVRSTSGDQSEWTMPEGSQAQTASPSTSRCFYDNLGGVTHL